MSIVFWLLLPVLVQKFYDLQLIHINREYCAPFKILKNLYESWRCYFW